MGAREPVRTVDSALAPSSVAEMADEIGRTRATVGAFLRERFPGDAPGKGRPWPLDPEHIAAVRERFSPR